jgi:GntR family transcriptional regulator, transcriptional repressor for pyruvate dehydrogenase complex
MDDPETEVSSDRGLFEPVATSRISSAIVDQIRELIGSGRLAAGDRLPSERELAEQFGVSRVTVRDAFRTLEAVGLLQIKVGANGGAFLRAPTSADAARGMSDMLLMAQLSPEDVAEARLMLELNTVMLAVRRAEHPDIEALRAICERSAMLLAEGEYDVHLSWDFHERLASATHNPAIELIHRSFRGPLSMARARAREPASLAHGRTVTEHTQLVDALADRDLERARAVLARHLVRATNLEDRLSSLGIPGLPTS